MANDKRIDPYRTFNFRVYINNQQAGSFAEAGGLTADGDSVEYREGEDPPYVRKLIGLRKYTNITLKRGYTQNLDLWNWYLNIQNGESDRRDVSVVLLNERREEVMRWHAENAWINKIEGPEFKASANEVAMESVELVHEGLTVETGTA